MNLDELLDLYVPEVAEAFRLAIADIVDSVVLADVIRAIELGDPVAAFKALGFSEAAMRPLTRKLEETFEAGGVATGATFPKRIYTNAGPTVYRFDMRNARAEKWIREQSSNLITHLADDTKSIVRTRLFEGLQAGNNPRTISLDIIGRYDRVAQRRIGGVIGLNKPQERAVEAMRQDLLNLDNNYFTRTRRDARFDNVVRELFDEGKVSSKRIEQLTTRYKDRLLKLRGDTIARDATMEALNHSEWEALKQAGDLGAIKNDGVTRVWDSSGDDGRTRSDHLVMEGQEVGLNEPFHAPDGSLLMHPQDRTMGASADQTINCRCRVRTKIDWLKELDGETLSEPTETLTQRNKRFDNEMKDDTVKHGLKTGKEKLLGYNAITGKVFNGINGSENFVGIPDDLLDAISKNGNNITLHHNHPLSKTFSRQDMMMMGDNPSLKTLYAHGHDGSSFKAIRLKSFDNTILDEINNDIAIPFIKREKEFTSSIDRIILFQHGIVERLKQKNYLKYENTNVGELYNAYLRNKELFDDIMKGLK